LLDYIFCFFNVRHLFNTNDLFFCSSTGEWNKRSPADVKWTENEDEERMRGEEKGMEEESGGET